MVRGRNNDTSVVLFSKKIAPIFLYSDNDKPRVECPVKLPVESIDNVTLTCVPTTNDMVTGYVWYKNSDKINGSSNDTYALPGNTREESGSYSCKVLTLHAPGSHLAEATNVTFLCKFHFCS